MISCLRVLHPWVSVRRPPICVAAAVVAALTTSKRAPVPHVASGQLLKFVLSVGQRRLIDLDSIRERAVKARRFDWVRRDICVA